MAIVSMVEFFIAATFMMAVFLSAIRGTPTTAAQAQFTESTTIYNPDDLVNSTEHSAIPLAKFVLTFSQPGAFGREVKAAFGNDTDSSEHKAVICPPGDEGLQCRRLEARRGADECSGGMCSSCRTCDEARATDWPSCCKNNFLCCSHLATACQKCDQPDLATFCTKRFKRCFQ